MQEEDLLPPTEQKSFVSAIDKEASNPVIDKDTSINWRIQLETKYALICKFCSRKVIDPDKSNSQQVFTKSQCPHCHMSKEQAKQKQPKQKFRIAPC